MNIELLERVAEQIESHPEKYDQNFWCGTQHCIAGTTLALCGQNIRDYVASDHSEEPTSLRNHIAEAAMQVLDLTAEQAGRLFLGGEDGPFERMWMTDSKLQYEDLSLKDRANAAADRIRHFIATEGRE